MTANLRTAALLGALLLAGCSNVDLQDLARNRDLDETAQGLTESLSPDKDRRLYVAPVEVTAAEDSYKEGAADRYGMAVDREKLMDELRLVFAKSFAAVKRHEDPRETRAEAAKAAFREGYDLMLVPRVTRYDAVFVKTNGWWWPNALFVAWYLYFPIWWIGDEVYGVQATLEYDLVSVRNERALPGLTAREVLVDSRQVEDRGGDEVPRGPRVALDDLDRGIDVLGTYHPGDLDRDQWRKSVQPLLEPYARRAATLAVGRDVAAQLARFHRAEKKDQDAATAAVHALVVGLGTYGPSDECAYADKDALAFASWLTGEPTPDAAPIGTGAIVRKTPAKLVRTLVNGRASRTEVLAELEKIALATRPEDTLVFYFAGRGTRGSGQGLKGFGLAFYGATKQDAPGSPNVLGLDELREVLSRARCERRFLVLDAAFGAGIRGTEAPRGNQQLDARALAGELVALGGSSGGVVLASGPDEPAHVLEPAKHGLLTYALVDGLLGAADADRQGVTWEALEKHVFRCVSTISELDLGAGQYPIVISRAPRSLVIER